jgi:hypothetical protein
VNEELKEKLVVIQKDIQEKEECLLKVFNEKEEVLGKYEALRLGIEEEISKLQGKVQIQERVARNVKRENEGKSKKKSRIR